MALVDVKGVTKRFGGLTAVSDVDLTVNAGEVHCLIGPNGAGKSTLFKLIVGLYPPTKGTIFFDSTDITEERPFARVQRGMSIKMQAPSVFKELPVRQNIQIALQGRVSGAERDAEEERLLTLLNLASDTGKLAGELGRNTLASAVLVRVVIVDPGQDFCSFMDAAAIGQSGHIQIVASLVPPHDQESLDPERLFRGGNRQHTA